MSDAIVSYRNKQETNLPKEKVMAEISLSYRVKETGDEEADLAAAKAGLSSLTLQVLDIIGATEFKNTDGDTIDLYASVMEWDECDTHDGVITAMDSIALTGGKDALTDFWNNQGQDAECGTYAEELAEADWMPFRDLVLAAENELGSGIHINLDVVSVSRNYYNGGHWFNHYQDSAEIRTEEEIKRDTLAAQKLVEARRVEALKVQVQKEERRKQREPLIHKYNVLAKQYGYAFKFINAEYAISQGIRIRPTTKDAIQFMAASGRKEKGGKFNYRFQSVDAMELALKQFTEAHQ